MKMYKINGIIIILILLTMCYGSTALQTCKCIQEQSVPVHGSLFALDRQTIPTSELNETRWIGIYNSIHHVVGKAYFIGENDAIQRNCFLLLFKVTNRLNLTRFFCQARLSIFMQLGMEIRMLTKRWRMLSRNCAMLISVRRPF